MFINQSLKLQHFLLFNLDKRYQKKELIKGSWAGLGNIIQYRGHVIQVLANFSSFYDV